MNKSDIAIPTDTDSDLERLRDRRIEPGACCKNCRFGYPYRVDLINSLLECRQGPAQYPIAMALDQGGNIVQSKIGAPVPRIVPESYFCGSWRPDTQ